jgi:putative transposase
MPRLQPLQVSGHGFQPCRIGRKIVGLLAPASDMAKPVRNARPESLRGISRTFFTTSKTTEGRNLLQSERMALLFIDVLRSHVAAKKFKISDFVVMPDHVHLQLTVNESMSIEKAMQLIKGGFSYRVRKELGYQGEIWQRGFSEIRILNRSSVLKHREYIDQNPVEAGLVDSPEKYPYSSAYLKWKKKRSG